MTAITFDTLPYIKKLRKAGVPDKQAEVHVEVTTDIMKNHIATKDDLQNLKASIHCDMNNLKSELKQDIANLTVKMGLMITGGATLFAVVLKLTSLI